MSTPTKPVYTTPRMIALEEAVKEYVEAITGMTPDERGSFVDGFHDGWDAGFREGWNEARGKQ